MSNYIHVIAGPNGAGKSTFIALWSQEVPQVLPDIFVSPDVIVEEERYANIENIRDRYIAAMKDAEAFRYALVDEGRDFYFETVLSSRNKLDFLKYAVSKGYTVELTYIGLESHYTAIDRVSTRVEEGGHDVPPEKIKSRWQGSLDVLVEAIDIVQAITILDNTGQYTPVVLCNDNTISYLDESKSDGYLKDAIDAIKRRCGY